MSTTKYALCMLLTGCLFLVTGCNEHAKMKQEMVDHWEESVALQKLSLAEGYIELGQVAEAKPILEKCLESIPANGKAYLLEGRIYFLEQENIKATESFGVAVQIDPSLDQAWYYLGTLAVIRKDYESAIRDYRLAYKLDPDNSEYRISLSDVLAVNNQIEEAEAILQEGLTYDSRNLELLLAMAQLKQQAGKIEDAVSIYEQAQVLHGAHPRILEPCAYGYVALKKWDQAFDKFERLLPQFKSDTQNYNATLRSLAMCAYHSGQYMKSLNYYDELSVCFRDDPEIWLNMAQAALGADVPGRAVYCAKKSLKLQSSPNAYAVLGSGLYIQGHYEQALDAFYEITDHEELAGFAWFMTGRCYQQLGQTAQANSAFDRAGKYDPNSELINIFLKRSVRSL